MQRQQNPGQEAKAKAKWRSQNLEKVRLQWRKFYAKNRDRRLKEMSEKYKMNPEPIKASARKYRAKNLNACRARSMEYHRKNRPRLLLAMKEASLKRLYGMSLGDFNKMKATQKLRCAICSKKRRLNVDHDHETGKVRGLLCFTCNTHLGWFDKLSHKITAYVSVAANISLMTS
jgi:hypothetical protein